jgi:type I restriction enzyme R subunit
LKDIISDVARKSKADELLKILDRDIKLRKKKELIEKFIRENLPNIDRSDEVESAFEIFWHGERAEALRKISEDEHIGIDALRDLIGEYVYTQRAPLGDDIIALLPEVPSILKRQSIIDRIKGAIVDVVERFEW